MEQILTKSGCRRSFLAHLFHIDQAGFVSFSRRKACHTIYSTLAKLMMKEDLDLSADDDDVHSWLDALNERELSR